MKEEGDPEAIELQVTKSVKSQSQEGRRCIRCNAALVHRNKGAHKEHIRKGQVVGTE